MILVDTSVLISFFKGIENEKTEKFENILINNIPFGINSFIYQEILQGASSEKEFKKLKEFLGSQKFYSLKSEKSSFEDASKLYFLCRKKGITIRSTLDVLIAQTAIEYELYLLHDDKDFDNMSKIVKNLRFY